MDPTNVSSKHQVVFPKRVGVHFELVAGQQLQVLVLPGRIELFPSQPPVSLWGFLQGESTFHREPDLL